MHSCILYELAANNEHVLRMYLGSQRIHYNGLQSVYQGTVCHFSSSSCHSV